MKIWAFQFTLLVIGDHPVGRLRPFGLTTSRLPHRQPVAILPAVLGDLRGGEFLLRVHEYLHGQHLSHLHRPRCPQRGVERPRGDHPDKCRTRVG
jgi:hypothetical protein